MAVTASRRQGLENKQPVITQLTVGGYKSIHDEISIQLRPLTVLAGANSSGKSSIMQPLLLLKQTLEASYDPGALLLNGPNIRFTSARQFLSGVSGKKVKAFKIGITTNQQTVISIEFISESTGMNIKRLRIESNGQSLELRNDTPNDELRRLFREELESSVSLFAREREDVEFTVIRERCFLEPRLQLGKSSVLTIPLSPFSASEAVEPILRGMIHLPGLRGNPERHYGVTAVTSNFPGTFQEYAASVIAQWVSDKSPILTQLASDLKELGLTWKVTAKRIDDTRVELRVGRMKAPVQGGAQDLVSIADVGFGVSQTLPVLVALNVARPGQLVYIEQPEIHLHPRAQVEMASVLRQAVTRGVRIVVETHSSLLLQGIQTLVAERRLNPEHVKLHWFQRRNTDGMTEVISADLDELGAFGDWPEDFADIDLETQSRYLDAVQSFD